MHTPLLEDLLNKKQGTHLNLSGQNDQLYNDGSVGYYRIGEGLMSFVFFCIHKFELYGRIYI